LWIFWWFYSKVLKKVAIKKPTLIGKKLSMAAWNTAGMSTVADVGNLDVCIHNVFVGDTWQAMCPSCHVGSFASNCYLDLVPNLSPIQQAWSHNHLVPVANHG
jgi:hypothetical protein